MRKNAIIAIAKNKQQYKCDTRERDARTHTHTAKWLKMLNVLLDDFNCEQTNALKLKAQCIELFYPHNNGVNISIHFEMFIIMLPFFSGLK